MNYTVSGDGDGELDGWILNLESKPSRWMMEDMIFTAPSSSSSPCLKTQNFATREWRRKMERKWRDKEDEMDEAICGKMKTKENGEEMVRQGDEMDEGIGD
ncbi:hypothetical protein RchiOBHm_Chr1g0371951 [Rosa chinensis]|uniref:Uncharacterized protein n=1 Tax=Rosa chinensis TaxID=74649 RepID=A0A2P6SLQ3_ROSCH|nr:hypothetical protein RchiOBHm_Chr1g0371951 [Rosa chinensis]